MIYEIELKIKDYAKLKIYTTYESIKNKIEESRSPLKRTIPITKVKVDKIGNFPTDLTDSIIVIPSDKPSMIYDGSTNCSTIFSNELNIRFPDLIYICLSMFSNILSRENKYLLHSSSLIDKNGKGIILVGESNAGKTTLAYELMVNNNYKLIANDHSVIGLNNNVPYIYGGTKDIQMRLGSLMKYYPDLSKKYINDNINIWQKKIVINDIVNLPNVLSETEDICPIENIYSISTMSEGNGFIRKKDRIDEFLFLYESFSKIIKGTYNYITGLNYPMPSMENMENLKNLANLCNIMADTCSTYDAKGSTSYLCRKM